MILVVSKHKHRKATTAAKNLYLRKFFRFLMSAESERKMNMKFQKYKYKDITPNPSHIHERKQGIL